MNPDASRKDRPQTGTPPLFRRREDPAVRISADGWASDMSPDVIMSGDGCNPVSRDTEISVAGDRGNEPGFPAGNMSTHPLPDMVQTAAGLFPRPLPYSLPGAMSGTFPGPVPPLLFPGSINTASHGDQEKNGPDHSNPDRSSD